MLREEEGECGDLRGSRKSSTPRGKWLFLNISYEFFFSFTKATHKVIKNEMILKWFLQPFGNKFTFYLREITRGIFKTITNSQNIYIV